MFAKSVIGSARFLRMPPTSRLLYYDLGMQADDDGVVEAFSVMRTTGATEDDLRVLASKGFVRVLNEDLVTYISDWNRNNYIQKDRYRPSIYTELLVKLDDGERPESDSQPSSTAMYTGCIQNVSKMDTQVRLGKVRLGKDRKDTCAEPETASAPPVMMLPLNDGTDYPVSEEQCQEWAGLYPAVDVIQQLRNMRGWLLSNKDRRKTRRGISRFITSWLSREQDRGHGAGGERRRDRVRAAADYESGDDFFTRKEE